jgi:IS605 OrfB family transposase
MRTKMPSRKKHIETSHGISKGNSNFITVECFLAFDTDEDKKRVIDLMRRFSSMVRFAYKRLLEKTEEKALRKQLPIRYGINARYSNDAILLAQQTLESCLERKQNPKKLIFGSRAFFKQLKKKHLIGTRREKLRKKWEERRYGILFARGEKAAKGNLNLRLVNLNGRWHLRINLGNGKYVLAGVIRSAKRKTDKWVSFISDIEQAEKTGKWFPYTVRMKLRNGKIYAHFSREEKFPEVTITKDNGAIGIDINAYPFHLAVVHTGKDGNLEKYERISLDRLLEGSSEKREYLSWQTAHQVIEVAKRERKALVMENLAKLPRGKRGDGLPKLRQRLQKWVYKALLQKIEIVARRNGIQVIRVNPAYTSIIGKLKYSPLYNIDKDTAGAYVIARRGLGFKERLPKNYKELLKDTEFLAYTIARVEDKITKLKQEAQEEKNEYKRNRLKNVLWKTRKELDSLLGYFRGSGESESAAQQAVNRELKPMRGRVQALQKSWQVLSVAFAFSCLESLRDFSPLKRILISRDWAGVANKASPSHLGQGTPMRFDPYAF